MSNWSIINIPPTADRDAVRRAYMSILPAHNPEDDPEGFVRLRRAYEEIIKELDKKQSTVPEMTPLELFMQRVEEVYNDFRRRRDIEEWRELIKDEVCVRLDYEDETCAALLTFLANHYYLPKSVWALLNGHFDWQNLPAAPGLPAAPDLPANFIDFVISSSQYQSLRYDLFEGNGDFDRWIWLYYEMEANLHAPDCPEFIEMKFEIEAMPIYHPYYDLQGARLHILKEEPEAALAVCTPIFEKMPDDPRAQYAYASALLGLGRAREACVYFREMLNKNPDDFGAKKGLVDALVERDTLECYEEARNLLLGILDKYPYNPFALHVFRLITDRLLVVYEEKYALNPDTATVLTIAKHCLNSYQYDKCQKILENHNFTDPPASYYEYLADCYAQSGNYNTAISLYEQNIVREKGYRNYVKFVTALIDAKKYGQALMRVEEGLALEDDKDELSLAYLHDNKGLILHNLGKYNEAVSAYDSAIRINSHAAHIYIHKARTYALMRRFAEALECCETSIDIFPYTPEAYTIQMKIYYEAEYYDKAEALVKRAEEFNVSLLGDIGDCQRLVWIYVRLEQFEKALAVLEEFETMNPEHSADITMRRALIYHKCLNDSANALKFYKLALKHDPNNAEAVRNIESLYLAHIKTILQAGVDLKDALKQLVSSIIKKER